jgi:hypothetical protein
VINFVSFWRERSAGPYVFFGFLLELCVGSEEEMTPRLHQSKVIRKKYLLLFFLVVRD